MLPGGKEHLDPEAFDSHQLVSDGWLQAELVGALVLALLGMLVQHMLERRRRTHALPSLSASLAWICSCALGLQFRRWHDTSFTSWTRRQIIAS